MRDEDDALVGQDSFPFEGIPEFCGSLAHVVWTAVNARRVPAEEDRRLPQSHVAFDEFRPVLILQWVCLVPREPAASTVAKDAVHEYEHRISVVPRVPYVVPARWW